MNTLLSILILFEIICNVAAQISIKGGMNRLGYFDFNYNNIVPIAIQVIASPLIIIGVLMYVISLAILLMILSRVEVSFFYPLTSLAFVLNAGVAYLLWGEHVTIVRLAGILVILLGVFLVAKS